MSGNIIVISSMSGIMRHAQGHFSYNAAKGGTVHLTKLMSAEFQKAGIRVNSIAPGKSGHYYFSTLSATSVLLSPIICPHSLPLTNDPDHLQATSPPK